MEQEETIQVKKERKIPVVVQIILYYVLWFVALMLVGAVAYAILGAEALGSTSVGLLVNGVGICVAAILPAWVMLRFVEHRPLVSLGFSLKGRGKDMLYGMLVAFAILGAGFGVGVLSGGIDVTAVSFQPLSLLSAFIIFTFGAVGEEIMMRGYILRRLLDARMNRFLALALSSFLFAFAHIFNPNLAFLPMLNLWLAGMLLGAAYLYTRNLWFAFSLHTFWNWMQGSVLGYKVSGIDFGTSLIAQHMPENNVLNGGSFGFEGSVLCSVFTVVATVGIIWFYERRKATPAVGGQAE